MNFIEITGLILGGGITGFFTVWKNIMHPIIKKRKDRKKAEKARQEAIEAEYRKKIDDIHIEMQVDGNGSLKTAIFNLRDATERIEFRLEGIEESQKVSMNLQGLAYWVSGVDGDWAYVSPNLCKLVGRSESEMLHNNWKSWIRTDDKDKVISAWEFSTENKTTFDEVYHIKKADGKFIKVWATAFHKRTSSNSGGSLGKMLLMEEHTN